MSKELWFAEYERLLNEGCSEEAATDRAYTRMQDRIADMADREKQRLKDEGKWPPHNLQKDPAK